MCVYRNILDAKIIFDVYIYYRIRYNTDNQFSGQVLTLDIKSTT